MVSEKNKPFLFADKRISTLNYFVMEIKPTIDIVGDGRLSRKKLKLVSAEPLQNTCQL